MELSPTEYSVQDIVDSVSSSLRSLAAEKGLEFVAGAQEDIPVAFGDGQRLAQCLMNLAGNALKFTKRGRVEIWVECQRETLVYRVSDTGIGIPQDQVETIFVEFQQAEPTITQEFGGTGLGLSITKKFVEMHGGRIWVESEWGKGSTFFFSIPLRIEQGIRRERQNDGVFLLLAHFHRHGGDRLVLHRHVLCHGSQTFLPELEGILARGNIIEHELPLVVCDRIEGMLGDHHPGPHPGVEVAVHPDDFRLREHDGNRPPSRLRPVEGGILRAGAMQVMQQAIGVQEFHRAADWHDHDARHVHALLLIHLHHR